MKLRKLSPDEVEFSSGTRPSYILPEDADKAVFIVGERMMRRRLKPTECVHLVRRLGRGDDSAWTRFVASCRWHRVSESLSVDCVVFPEYNTDEQNRQYIEPMVSTAKRALLYMLNQRLKREFELLTTLAIPE